MKPKGFDDNDYSHRIRNITGQPQVPTDIPKRPSKDHVRTKLSWRDSRLKFLFLKDLEEKNVINTQVWVPKLTFRNMKELLIEEKDGGNLNVRKEGKMTTNDRSELVMAEVFQGSENTIYLLQNYQIKFICTFKDIHLYPFDEEMCYIEIVYGGAAPGLVDLIPGRSAGRSVKQLNISPNILQS